MDCLICERIERIKSSENPYFVYELETGYVVIGDHQHFFGYSLFLCKEHVTELHFLPKAKRLKHLEEVSLVYEAVYNAFKPEKINCELLGNGDSHVHWHIFPQRAGDMPRKGPVWWLPQETMYNDANRPSPAALEAMKELLRKEIETLVTAV
ncbi:MAG: HIT family protein [Clostridiales bacterium]|jgi:diadenosine tetraphosphate (Ap4A) HIT family hydrolase|nr:HIT family protein [Clostridiales bacterium]